MPLDRELREVTCYGCGAIFESHSRSVVYCCWTCSFLTRAMLRSWQPRCLCGAEIEMLHPENGAPLTPEEYWQAHKEFESKHRSCLRTALDRDEGAARLACRCKPCRRGRGELLPKDEIPQVRRRRSRQDSPTYARNRVLVLERDGWTCQICGLPLDREASTVDDLYPQVDHIRPVALGGDDELGNLRAAHRWCNLALSTIFSPTDDQVREVAHLRYASRNPAVVARVEGRPGSTDRDES